MLNRIIPNKLNKGDTIRIICPAASAKILTPELNAIAMQKMQELGLNVTFGKHIYESDELDSTSIEARLDDLYDAFSDQSVKAIIAGRGGYNSNQLLPYINWDIIRNNPKIFCGFSDITALNNAFFAKTGLVTYSTPNYSNFSQKLYFDYPLDSFKKCLFNDSNYFINYSSHWSDDEWYKNQEDRHLIPNNPYYIINKGENDVYAGTILGGNLSTFNLLQGTACFPDLTDAIIFIEDDSLVNAELFDRYIHSLLQQKNADKIKAFVIGRFQKESNISYTLLKKIFLSNTELNKTPIIAGVDFGHTDPQCCFPIGGEAKIAFIENEVTIEITTH